MKVILVTCAAAALLAYCLIDNFDPSELKGKNVFITGASMGIGEQIAYHYAKLGANVVVAARKEARLKEVVKECKELSGNDAGHDYIAADLGKLATLETIAQSAIDKLNGKIDILVLNHVIFPAFGEWMGTSENITSLDTNIDVNFKSYVHLASYFLPYLEQTHGQIIVSSATAGKFSQPYLIPYSTTKFALEGFFSGLRHELIIKKSTISVTLCVIGYIATKSADDLMQGWIDSEGADPGETAMTMISGGALRKREVHFPFHDTTPFVLLRDIIPGAIEAVIGHMHGKRSS